MAGDTSVASDGMQGVQEEDVEEVEEVNDEEETIDDEPDAEVDEADEPRQPLLEEPSYRIANSLSFSRLANTLEYLYRLKIEKPKDAPSQAEKLNHLLPSKFLKKLNDPRRSPPESIFPILRLLAPDIDSSRSIALKESRITEGYQSAFGWSKTHPSYQKLVNFTDPKEVGPDEGVGDFPQVLQGVLKDRLYRNNTIKVGEVNDLLDELAEVTRNRSRQNPTDSLTPKQRRGEWFSKLIKRGVSPLEHKWIVRIILGKVEIKVGWSKILQWCHPLGPSFWSAHNSLRAVCTRICQPAVRNLHYQQEDQVQMAPCLAPYFEIGATAAIEFGNPFTPMLSERTGFSKVLTHMALASKRYQAREEDEEEAEEKMNRLPIKFPAFAVETKLDGERCLIHFSRKGVVKIHTRRGNWYSEMYSPVLGPALRRALLHNGLDLILDGEVLAWDNGRKETIPFGNNRTIAILRRNFMKKLGEVEAIDENLHHGETGVKSLSSANTINDSSTSPNELTGEQCWLQFIAFDVIYVNGPSATEFLKANTSNRISEYVKAGSIMSLEASERKKLLYKLIQVQEKEVEVVPTLVIRPNGTSVEGSQYFNVDVPFLDSGVPAVDLDSAARTFHDELSTKTPRSEGEFEVIATARARAIENHYKKIVEGMRQEGLLFKVLSAPYILDSVSRSLGYWRKFKPDYYNGSVASDLDLIVIGAYFATGLRLSGLPSSLLCACVDSKDTDVFYTVCKVNAGSMEREVLSKFLKSTGYRSASEGGETNEGCVDFGKWFSDDNHDLPDFVSPSSFQKDQNGFGWRWKKIDYPDLWIHPRDSYVVTLNAGEIVPSDNFSLGLTLRFPRIVKVRLGGDAKEPEETENEERFWDIYKKVTEERSRGVEQPGSNVVGSSRALKTVGGYCRFLTEAQSVAEDKKMRSLKKRKKLELCVDTAEVPQTIISDVLDGYSFRILEGVYRLERDKIAVEEANEEGWLRDAQSVKSHKDVAAYIKQHSGQVVLVENPGTMLVGGLETDSRVTTHMSAIEIAIQQVQKKRKTSGKPTKADLKYSQLSRDPGVLRWTYIYSAVHELTKLSNSFELQPSRLDYLACPSSCEDIFGNLQTKSALRRALGLISKKNKEASSRSASDSCDGHRAISWRERAKELLPEDHLWIVGSPELTPFWGCSMGAPERPHVFYPNLFDSNSIESLDDDTIWKSLGEDANCIPLLAVLPLIRTMGGTVVTSLDSNVTHILVDSLPEGALYTTYKAGMDLSYLQNADALAKRLCHLGSALQDEIILVTPVWIRGNWSV